MSPFSFISAVSDLKYGFTIVLFLSGLKISAQQASSAGTDIPAAVKCDSISQPGTIRGDQVIHPGDIPQLLLESTPPDGPAGRTRYLWMEFLQLGSMPGQWYPILSATSPNYQPGPLLSTRKFMRCATQDGCNVWKQSNIVTVTVQTADF